MGAGNASASLYNSNPNLNTFGGNKKQGITSRIGNDLWSNRAIQTNSNGIGRKHFFCINQVGNIGRTVAKSGGVHCKPTQKMAEVIQDVPMDARVIHVIPIDAPAAISAYESFAWVSTYDNLLCQIDGNTHSIIQTIPLETTPTAISAYGPYVWYCNDGTNIVTRVDVLTQSMIQIPIGNVMSRNFSISVDGSDAWVATSSGTVVQIDIASHTITRTIYVGNINLGISAYGPDVWVCSSLNDTTGNVTQINAATGVIVATLFFGIRLLAISADDSNVWVCKVDNTVAQIDVATQTVVATIPIQNLFPQSISAKGAYAWVINQDDNAVSQIDIATQSVKNTIPVGLFPVGISASGAYVWVANQDGNSISQIIY